MKHTAFLIWLIAACAIALPSESLASYLIKLKNGSQYVTSEYWEEGNQIKFKISGGEIGFSKDSILRITETDLPVEAEIITPETPSTSAEKTSGSATPSEPGTEAKGAPEVAAPSESAPSEIDHEVYMARKRAILQRIQINEERFNQALENKNREAEQAAVEELNKTTEAMNELIRQIREENNGDLPDWWNTLTE